MEAALAAAEAAAARGEVPVGAALYDPQGRLLAVTANRILELKDPTAHAELLAIREGARLLGNERLLGTTLVATLEPCAMCAGALALARVGAVIFGAADPKGGAILHGPRLFEQPTLNHRPRVLGPIGPEACGAILKTFFERRRMGDAPPRGLG
jgi:tRNA(Arg) A34 adenosine deaminase TadA